MGTFIDLLGNKYGKLKVVERLANNKLKQATWKCLCNCGNEVVVSSGALRKGNTKSCGCYKKESLIIRNMTHGRSYETEYKIWVGMKNRCYNVRSKNYSDYGGRGISVSDSWKNAFESFLNDLGRRPSEKHSLERIDNDLNYEKTNCKWATKTEQANNQRIKRTNTSGHIGVGWSKESEKWVVGIRVKNKKIHLGYYSDINKAIEARKNAETKYLGRSS